MASTEAASGAGAVTEGLSGAAEEANEEDTALERWTPGQMLEANVSVWFSGAIKTQWENSI